MCGEFQKHTNVSCSMSCPLIVILIAVIKMPCFIFGFVQGGSFDPPLEICGIERTMLRRTSDLDTMSCFAKLSKHGLMH